MPERETLKAWNLRRMSIPGAIKLCVDVETLWWYIEHYPDLCGVCLGQGTIGIGQITPIGLLVEEVRCPACGGVGVERWYCQN
jgi:hypothetical protein